MVSSISPKSLATLTFHAPSPIPSSKTTFTTFLSNFTSGFTNLLDKIWKAAKNLFSSKTETPPASDLDSFDPLAEIVVDQAAVLRNAYDMHAPKHLRESKSCTIYFY
jgi:hypothetical protein